MVVKEVMPFELMKLRLLNGSHVSLSFFSTLLGYAKVDVAMKDQLIRKYVEDYLDEGKIIFYIFFMKFLFFVKLLQQYLKFQ